MSYAPAMWAPPPVPRGKWNAEEQHEFATVVYGAADWLERHGSAEEWRVFTDNIVAEWRRVKASPDEVFEVRFRDGAAWSVTGAWCCCGWKVSWVRRVAPSKTLSEVADEALATRDIAPLVDVILLDNPFARSLRYLAEREAQLARTGTLGGIVKLTPEARRRCAIRGRAALMAAARLPDERARRLP